MSSSAPHRLAPLLPLRPPGSLLLGLRAREPAASAMFFDRWVDGVERAVHAVLGPDLDAEDVVQDAFVAALRGIDGFRGDEAALGPWGRGIAVRLALRRIRWRRARRWLGMGGSDVIAGLHGPTDTHLQAALGRAYALLDRLPATERAAFSLRFVEGMALEEVADAIGVSLATAKRRLTRAREAFTALASHDAILQAWLDGRTPR